MTAYIEVLAMDRPADIGTDDNDRVIFSLNFQIQSQGTITNLEREIAKLITNAGLGTGLGTDIFIGTLAKLPVLTSSTPVINITATGGLGRDQTHNYDAYERPSCQITVRSKDYAAAQDRALAIWRALDGQRNFSVTA